LAFLPLPALPDFFEAPLDFLEAAGAAAFFSSLGASALGASALGASALTAAFFLAAALAFTGSGSGSAVVNEHSTTRATVKKRTWELNLSILALNFKVHYTLFDFVSKV